jgi:tetratricopeptide (TPR) repeat protein
MRSCTKGYAVNVCRRLGLAGFVLACTWGGSHTVFAQQFAVRSSLSLTDTTHQQTNTSPSTADLPVMTPELQADVLAARQHYMAAIDAYKKIDPQTAEIENKIAMAYQRMDRRGEAHLHYARAIHMDRRYAPAYNNLGTMDFHDKDTRHAERLYRKAIKLDAKVPAFWSNLGAAYLADNRYRDGAEAYQRAFALNSDIFDELSMNGIRELETPEDLAKMDLCFAEIYAQAGDKVQALVYIRKALSEGYHDKAALQQNQQFASLRGNPAFDQLIAQPGK